MPKVSKKKRFRGQNRWDVLRSGSSPEPVSTSSNNLSSPPVSTPVDETASIRKISSRSTDRNEVLDGAYSYRLVELSNLVSAFQPLHTCELGGELKVIEDKSRRYGSSSVINIECSKCDTNFKLLETRTRFGSLKVPWTPTDEWFIQQWKLEWEEKGCWLCVTFSTCLRLAIIKRGITMWLHCTRPTRKLLLNSYSRPELKYFHAIAVMNQMLQRLLSVMMEHGKKEAIQQISGLALSFQLKLVRYLTMAWSQNYVWNAQQQRRIWVKIPVSSTCGSVVTKINAPKLTLARVDLWSVR